jgi:hypothetical protein
MLSSSFRCDQIYEYQKYDFGHTFYATLSQTDVEQTHLRSAAFNTENITLSQESYLNKEVNCTEPSPSVIGFPDKGDK